jgi:hypothetical protein
MRRTSFVLLAAATLALGIGATAQQAQEGRGGRGAGGAQPAAPAAGRGPAAPPPLFFRESFNDDKTTFTARPLAATDVTNPNLELKMYGPGAPAKPDHESGIELDFGDDPLIQGAKVSWVWTGMAEGPWAVTLRDKQNFVNLTGLARIRWRVRMRGVNELRPIVKLADGTMLLGDYTEPASVQWRQNEFFLSDVPRWKVLDQKEIIGSTDAAWRSNPDLSRVDEVGFTDMMRGAGHGTGGNSGIDWIEVYGTPVRR